MASVRAGGVVQLVQAAEDERDVAELLKAAAAALRWAAHARRSRFWALIRTI